MAPNRLGRNDAANLMHIAWQGATMIRAGIGGPESRISGMAPIVAAELHEVEMAFAKPYALSKAYGTLTTAQAVLLKLIDADGVVGWGEANPKQPFTKESPAQAREALRDLFLPALFKMTSPDPGVVDVQLDRLHEGQLCAKGAVSMALLDIAGKRLQLPVAALLGGALRTTLPVLWPLGAGSVEEDISIIDEKASQGFSTFMLKMGVVTVQEEIDRVTTLEARYGGRFKFIADANQGWTRSEAEDFVRAAKDLPLIFLEQPVAKEDLEAMAELRAIRSLPISADESLTGLEEAGRHAALGAADIFSIKSSKNGGPLRAQQIATVARAFGINCYMNSMLELGITQAASLHHAMTIPNLVDAGHAFMSTLRFAEDPTNFSSFVRGGIVTLPTEPGLGIIVDDDHVARMATFSELLGAIS